jgi:hypothetical protein
MGDCLAPQPLSIKDGEGEQDETDRSEYGVSEAMTPLAIAMERGWG